MNETVNSITLTDEDINWVLNDDPNDIDNQLLGDYNIQDIGNTDGFSSRFDNMKETVFQIGEFAIDNIFGKLFTK